MKTNFTSPRKNSKPEGLEFFRGEVNRIFNFALQVNSKF
jgi:hypothetical protein